MFVHVVKLGESLFSIAKLYGGTAERIRAANELEEDHLIPGMSLVIPAGPPTTLAAYTVKAGDTWQTLAKQFRVPPQVIRGINARSTDEELLAGQTIWLPIPVAERSQIEVNAYMVPTGSSMDREIIEDVADCLTCLSLFNARITADGNLTEIADEPILAAAKQKQVSPILTVTNFDGANFNSDLAQQIFANLAVREQTIANLISHIKSKGYQGVNLDFEHLRPADRQAYNLFVREAAKAARAAGVTVYVTVPPKTADDPQNPWVGAFDYRTLGQLADAVTLLTFEWGWIGGEPMAIAPLDKVRSVMEYATTEIPAAKIMLGMALYGYNWAIPHAAGNRATGVSPKGAVELAVRSKSHIHFQTESASPMFTYRSTRDEMRQVWYEDARSVLAKFHLVQEMGLRGISYWMLGHPFPQNWTLLDATFQIRKVGL